MKKNVLLSAVAIFTLAMTASCGGGNGQAADNATPAEVIEQADTTVEQAVDRFLVDSIANRYGSGKINIPQVKIIDRQQNGDTVKVLGDFWVFNYDIAGDTLKCVSGGHHAGMLIVSNEGGAYRVTGFDPVTDGNTFEPSAKRIFGDKYERFHAIYSDSDAREALRDSLTAAYVKAHNLPVKCYQDYGWPARPL